MHPSHDQLRLFQEERLAPADNAAVAAHLETCPQCQAFLDRATPFGGDTEDGRSAEPKGKEGPSLALAAVPPLVAGYEMLSELGRGGMGVVYKARHTRLDRVVALKMLRAGDQAGPGELARFRSEAALQARVQHPHIVQIFEVGEVDGRPYFAQEFVEGPSLDKKIAGAPQPARSAAQLVETLARAMHHAHQKGLVHRDLKPANVLLTVDGMPKVGDFGLAKRLEADAGQTQTGTVMGTASYMAPEQAWGRIQAIGPATDVYALGAILYELLTGRPPFLGPTAPDTVLQVRSQEPVPVRRVQPNVPKDLETICLTCLQKEPAKRYASAAALADDLQRFRYGESIRARPSPTWEKALKWAKRKPAAAALIGVSGLALLTLFGVVLGFTVQLRAALKATQDQRDLAESREKEALREKQIAEAVRTFLQQDLLQQADASAQANALRQTGGGFEVKENPTIKELLDRAAAELTPGKIEAKFPDQLEVQASILKTVGDTYRGIGAYGQAVEFLSRSSDAYRQVFGADHADTLNTLSDLGWAYQNAGKLAEALALFEQVRDAQMKKLGADHPATLVALHNLALTYRAAGKTAAALALLEQVRDAQLRKLGGDHFDTLTTLLNLAGAYQAAGRTAAAIALFEQVRDAFVRKLGADHPATLATLNNLANAYQATGRTTAAIALFEQVRDANVKKLGADHPHTLATLNNLASAYRAAGKTAAAIALCERIRDARVQKLGADHPETLATLDNLAAAYFAGGKTGEAIALFEHVRDARVEKLGANHPDTLATLNNLALAYRATGKTTAAIALFEQVRDVWVQKLGADHPHTLTTLDNLAGAYWAAGKTAAAIALYEQVRDASVQTLGADHPDTLTTLHNLAGAYRDAGKMAAAIALFEQVRDVRVQKLGSDHPHTLTTLHNLAVAYRASGKTAEAIALYEQVRDARVQKLGADHPDTLTTLHSLAVAYQAAGRTAAAIALFEHVRDARVQKLGADHPDTLTTLDNLAGAYRDAGKMAAAIALFEQVRDARVQQLGADHPHTLTTLNNLAVAYRASGKTAEAIALFEQVRDARMQTLGADHPDAHTALANLASAYLATGKVAQALPLFQQAAKGIERCQFRHEHAGPILRDLSDCHERLQQYEPAEVWRRKWLAVVKERAGSESTTYAGELAALGLNLLQQHKHAEAEQTLRDSLALRSTKEPEAWTTFNTKSLLGDALLRQQKYAGAEPLLKEGYEGLKAREQTIPPKSKVRLTEALERLVKLYDAWGKPEQAATWRQQLDQAKNPPKKPAQ
jgi:DNA-binding SARP family transcriptional activator